MAIRTLAGLRDRAKKRASLENSTFISDTEWDEYINYAISELRDIIISKVGDDYFAVNESYSLVSGQEGYDLPGDFYKVLWVELLCDDGNYRKMKRYEISEQQIGTSVSSLFVPDFRYRLIGNKLNFSPNNQVGGRTARMWYVPLLAELESDSDELVGFNGWDEYPVLRAAINALEKQEQDTSALSLRLEQLKQRIEAMSENRDQSQPMRIYDNQTYIADYEIY